jgi:AcrR family transcriptional regulator
MNGFERRREQKKENIRHAALTLFKAYGFKKVTVNDIARQADVSPVTIYNYFGSRDALVQDVVKGQFVKLLEKMRAIIDGEGSFLEKLETMIFDKTEFASQFHGEFAQVLFQSNPEMRQFVEDVWKGGVTRLTIDFLEEGKKQGFISRKLSQEALLLYLEILRRGVSASPEMFAGREMDIRLLRELNYLFVYGMLGTAENGMDVREIRPEKGTPKKGMP